MTEWPSVTVIIVAAASSHSLPAALAALSDQDYPGTVEVVVAAADTPTAQAAQGHDVLVVDNPTGRTPVGLNLAARAGSGEILVRIDAHSTVPPDYIRRLVEILTTTNADNVGGRQVPVGTTSMEKAIAAAMSSRFGAGDARYRIGGDAGPTDTVYLGAFPRAVFERLGGYDERFLRNQDYELNHRIRVGGGLVWFDPTIAVTYRPRTTLVALARQYFQYGRWKRFFARTHRTLRPRQLVPPLLVVVLAVSLIGSIWWSWLAAIPALYLIGLLVVGLTALPRLGLPAFLMPVALGVMHIAWGAGFLVGQSSDR